MATAIEVINHALSKAGVTIAGQAASDDKAMIALEILNDWVASLPNEAIDLDIATLDLDDELYVDDKDLFAIKLNLTVLCAEHWKLEIPQMTMIRAERALNDILERQQLKSFKDIKLDPMLTDHTIASDVNTN